MTESRKGSKSTSGTASGLQRSPNDVSNLSVDVLQSKSDYVQMWAVCQSELAQGSTFWEKAGKKRGR